MGQKVHPIGLRVGIIRDWDAKWYAEKEYADYLHEDLAIRKFIQTELADASVSRIEIERAVNKVIVSLHTAKPGMVIGKGGANVDALRAKLNKLTGKQVHINIVEIKQPDLDAHLVGENIARQLEQRVAFRRAQKQAIQRTMRAGAKGIKTQVSGRLNGADIARAEGYSEGTVPLHTLRADIDYAWQEADTTYGKLGVKVWIYRGEVLPARKNTKGGKYQMLVPKRVKHRREFRGKMRGEAKGGKEVAFGEYGLQATTSHWITNRQIEAARIAMTRYMKRGGKVWIKIFPHKSYTAKAIGVRMGSGKGAPEGWVAPVKRGKVMFEIAGVSEEVAREALRLASHKLPVKTKFVKREAE